MISAVPGRIFYAPEMALPACREFLKKTRFLWGLCGGGQAPDAQRLGEQHPISTLSEVARAVHEVQPIAAVGTLPNGERK